MNYVVFFSVISELLDAIAGICIHNGEFLESFLPYTLVKNIVSATTSDTFSTEDPTEQIVSTSQKFAQLFEAKLDSFENVRFLLSWMLSKRKCNILVALSSETVSTTFQKRLQNFVDSCTEKRKAKLLACEHVSELKKVIKFE